ncbi:MAG: glutamine-hydrolyzing GMP synthase [Opitutales bacterium]|nr:glutamine-hydrolyzing GMP synthase [Opitutales bacterium]
MHQTIAVLDFGSQYTQVIARRIRECGVYSKIYPFNTPAEELKDDGVIGIICSGGPSSVLSDEAPLPDRGIYELGLPVLGICYGIQLMAHLLGGKVETSTHREFGHGAFSVVEDGTLLKDLPKSFSVWNSHGDRLMELPEGFHAIGTTENSAYAAIEHTEKRFYGLQFHPEVHHSEYGKELLENFLVGVCGCRQDWSMRDFINESVEDIRKTVGDHGVILGLSGGVDSSVAAALIHRAIGDQLTCVFVDNGLLRLDERKKVEELYAKHFHLDVRVVDAVDHFLGELEGVEDPERKRKIIGRVFVEIFEQKVEELAHERDYAFLGQGTLYPDIIESVPIGGNPAALIKSHHNVGGLPERMKLKVIEPLNQLFKDEVRKVGEALGLPKEVVWRQPFPGPGLAVRHPGTIVRENLDTLRQADAILIEEMKETGLYYDFWQTFCVFLPVRSVGVMGDERTFEHAISIRAVESVDAMTADWARIPYDLLRKISNRIINEVKGVNRVLLDISSKPPATIEWE